jgi:hypothetical protein
MPLEDSPSLNQYKNGIPDNLPSSSDQKKTVNFIIYALVGLIIILGSLSFLKTNNKLQLAGSGVISGYTVDEYDQPVSAEVFISGADEYVIAGVDGYFQIEGVPAGDYSIIVGYNYVGSEYPVEVNAGGNTDMGYLKVPPAHKPSEF